MTTKKLMMSVLSFALSFECIAMITVTSDKFRSHT